ncbi:hypothetical protein [Candidatus Methylacidithermus pantelleriae]|uniref:Uncharacterized protein n=1 Tax=Candidatus Methylacidithermus pantelleriae TaxID=2744239 RepID=A0A8J2BJ13_9BACT|nr:hypothetical protein [Candidatus Methylacidithermus pantelleriae]CAF0695830.1 hypothetical protein MPNT_20026 [Candidatus Methylacidithermus pantelleriae]
MRKRSCVVTQRSAQPRPRIFAAIGFRWNGSKVSPAGSLEGAKSLLGSPTWLRNEPGPIVEARSGAVGFRIALALAALFGGTVSLISLPLIRFNSPLDPLLNAQISRIGAFGQFFHWLTPTAGPALSFGDG